MGLAMLSNIFRTGRKGYLQHNTYPDHYMAFNYHEVDGFDGLAIPMVTVRCFHGLQAYSKTKFIIGLIYF